MFILYRWTLGPRGTASRKGGCHRPTDPTVPRGTLVPALGQIGNTLGGNLVIGKPVPRKRSNFPLCWLSHPGSGISSSLKSLSMGLGTEIFSPTGNSEMSIQVGLGLGPPMPASSLASSRSIIVVSGFVLSVPDPPRLHLGCLQAWGSPRQLSCWTSGHICLSLSQDI